MEGLKDKQRIKREKALLLAVGAAACYGVSAPMSKLLLASVPPTLLAALLYLGAGLAMAAVQLLRSLSGRRRGEARLAKADYPYALGMVLLDIAAPVLLLYGLRLTSPANASLMNNFEIVATAMIAMLLFKEAVGRRMWAAIALITLASAVLSFEDISSFSFSAGSVLVLLACLCWGLENNCTRKLSLKDPLQIVLVKGFGSGTGALLISLAIGEPAAQAIDIALALLLGCFAYGLSIYLYILAQRELGAARTSAYYAVAPFIGVGLSFLVYSQPVTFSFLLALALMLPGAYLASVERHAHAHVHPELTHAHRHSHTDGHHSHPHDADIREHSHEHTHEPLAHAHHHTPDSHHRHSHA